MSNPIKQLRGQVRQVVKEIFPDIFTKEVQENMTKNLAPLVEQGLGAIKEQVTSNIEHHRKAQSEIENKLLTAASNHLNQMNLTMLAWQQLIQEHMESACIIDSSFTQKLEDRKKAIADSLKPKVESKE